MTRAQSLSAPGAMVSSFAGAGFPTPNVSSKTSRHRLETLVSASTRAFIARCVSRGTQTVIRVTPGAVPFFVARFFIAMLASIALKHSHCNNGAISSMSDVEMVAPASMSTGNGSQSNVTV